ncbi:MAG: ATP-binding SpoIIE family protein phosphatase [Acidimicrobiia bacterium]|nr:ATP-binding SpoIIE family protein phosphatase [Acidimicrobiia bacterium]
MALGMPTAISTRRRRAAERGIRTIADTLQRSLLPTSFPDRPEIELVGRYEARAEHAIVGGDWYDVLELTPDCIGLVIGDVSGHSIEAMATMARLRYSFGAEAYDRTEPAVVMQRMHELLDDAGPSGFTTVFYAVLDLVDGNLTYTSAGHPPPVVLEPDGSTRLLDGRPGVLLGTDFENAATRPWRSTLEPGSTLALYTDGLVERRREPIDVGIDRLRQSLTRGPREPLEQLADAVFGDLVGRWTRDDVALLIVRWVEPATDDESSDAEVLVSEKPGRNGSSTTDEPGEGGGPPVEVDADAETQDAGSMETNEVKATFPADLSAAHSGRRLVASTLDRWQLPQLIDDAELLSSELVSNAVSHGDGGGVDVRVVRESSRVRIEVTDDGDGHPHVRSASSPRPGGYGLVVVDRVAADWGVLPTGARGKTVWATLEAS